MRILKTMHENERFSSTEQAIIKYIMEHPQQIESLSIRELAEKTFTSPAAVFRLCQKFGLKGYNEFKIRFISEMHRVSNDGTTMIHRPITPKDSPADIVRKMAALEVEAIEETKNEMDVEQMTRIVDMMEKAKIIDIYAYDQNYQLAQMAVYNLLAMQFTAVAHNSMNSQFSAALISDATHVAFIISRSGENKKLIRIAKILKERNVKTVLFTISKDSQLADICDEFLYVANTFEYLDFGGSVFSVGVRYLEDVLTAMLLSRHYESSEKFYEIYEKNIGATADPDRLW